MNNALETDWLPTGSTMGALHACVRCGGVAWNKELHDQFFHGPKYMSEMELKFR